MVPGEDAVDALMTKLPAGLRDDVVKCFGRAGHDRHQGQCVSFVNQSQGRYVAIWLKPNAQISVLAHEAVHAAWYALSDLGMKFSDESDEAFAYYIGWIVGHLTKLRFGKASTL